MFPNFILRCLFHQVTAKSKKMKTGYAISVDPASQGKDCLYVIPPVSYCLCHFMLFSVHNYSNN